MDVKNIMRRIVLFLFLFFLFLYSVSFYYRIRREEQAQAFIYSSVQDFENGDYYAALYGKKLLSGFYGYMLQYYGTYAGNTSRIYAGVCFIKLGDYNFGIKCLLSAEISDKIIRSKVLSFLGDAYMALKDYSSALKSYLEAASLYDNEIDTPEFLFKAVFAYEMLGQYDEALAQLQTILLKYKNSAKYSEFLEEQKKLDFVIKSKNK